MLRGQLLIWKILLPNQNTFEKGIRNVLACRLSDKYEVFALRLGRRQDARREEI
jgi:hypothetical protein